MVDYGETDWGTWEILYVLFGSYKIVQVIVKPGRFIPMHYHQNRTESWTITSGSGELQISNNLMFTGRGDVLTIYPGQHHRMLNVGEEPLVIIEVQIGEMCTDEDEIITEIDTNE